MIRNFFLIAIRNLAKHKGYSLITVLGLTIGMACAMLLTLYVRDELAVDRFHENAERIYRVNLHGQVAGQIINIAQTAVPVAPAAQREIPGVETAIRIDNSREVMIRHGDLRYHERNFFWADPEVFAVFTYPLVDGDPVTALANPGAVVISESVAAKYFPDGEALGRTLLYEDRFEYLVTGIMRDVPVTAHFRPEFIASLSSLPKYTDEIWLNNNLYTFLLLEPGADPRQVEARFEDLVVKYVGPQMEMAMGQSLTDARASGMRIDYRIQALPDIYLHATEEGQIGPVSDILYIYILSGIALIILLLAGINFTNLSTARAANRAREVGMRKVMGSRRMQLIGQFLGESSLQALVAFLLALAVLEVALPWFRTFSGKALDPGGWDYLLFVAGMAGVAVLTGVLGGAYPAFLLSAFQPSAVLKGELSRGSGAPWLRSILVTAQFAISIVLLICTGVVYQQLVHMQTMRLGFNKDQVMILPLDDDTDAVQFGSMADRLAAMRGVESVAMATGAPAHVNTITGYRLKSQPEENIHLLADFRVSHDYLATLELDLVAGRGFSRDFTSEMGAAAVVNEATLREMGLAVDNAVGAMLVRPTGDAGETEEFTIVGVVRDFHISSLHEQVRPLVMVLWPDEYDFLLVRLTPTNLEAALPEIRSVWESYQTTNIFTYSFLDEDFLAYYRSEQRLGRIFAGFTALAMLVACLGLFGLAAFVTRQRTREVGVRKVLGASVPRLMALLTRHFLGLVLLANLVAWPVAWLLMRRWLQNFAFPVELSPLVFLGAGVLAALIALVTVGYQAARAALANPVESLKYQ